MKQEMIKLEKKISMGIKKPGYIEIPTYLFRDRSVAVLEALVEYLKDAEGLSYHEIAMMLNRDDRTIWTVYNRVKIKRRRKSTLKKTLTSNLVTRTDKKTQ